MKEEKITVNRAPVLTLWAIVVAERMGYDHATALTLGKAVAGLNAQSKGVRLGIYKPSEETPEKAKLRRERDESSVIVLGRPVPVVETKEGIRATSVGKPIPPDSVERYLKQKFGDDLSRVMAAMQELTAAYKAKELSSLAYKLYEEFRPEIPEGTRGWGARGELDLNRIRSLAKKRPQV